MLREGRYTVRTYTCVWRVVPTGQVSTGVKKKEKKWTDDTTFERNERNDRRVTVLNLRCS